jgi:hypothetical protein
MRAISIKPPFSTWIMAGHKKTEFRRYRIAPGPLAIHASARAAMPAEISAWLLAEFGKLPSSDVLSQLCRLARRAPRGVILGIVTVTHSSPSNTIWGRWCNHLADPEPFDVPIAAKGNLGIWRWTPPGLRLALFDPYDR